MKCLRYRQCKFYKIKKNSNDENHIIEYCKRPRKPERLFDDTFECSVNCYMKKNPIKHLLTDKEKEELYSWENEGGDSAF